MNKKIFVILVAIAVIIIAIFGSNLFKKEVKTTPSLTKISVALDWYPNSVHTGLFIAQERGYYEEEGLDVNIVTPADPSTVLQTVSSGRDDFGIGASPDVLLAREKGLPIVSIIALVQHPLSSVMTLKTSGISQPKDMAGKKVGFTGAPYGERLLDAMLRNQGKSLADVEVINVGFDFVPALISKKVDAIVPGFWNHDSLLAEKQGFPVNIMRVEEYGVPDYYELVMVTNEKKIQEDKDIVQRFVRAVQKGYEDAFKDPQGTVKILKKLKPEVDLSIDSRGVDLLTPLWKSENGVFGWQEEKRWTDFAKWMKENGLISKDLDVKAAFDNSFVENAAKK